MTITRDDLVERCLGAEGIGEVLDILRGAARDGLAPGADDDPFVEWHRSEELTVQRILWPPGFEVQPHDHGGVWAAVAVLAGTEENRWFREEGGRVAPAGGRAYDEGEVVAMGGDAIHAIRNPRMHEWAVTVHVYGGDLRDPSRERRGWVGDRYECVPYDGDAVTREFFAAVSAARRSTS